MHKPWECLQKWGKFWYEVTWAFLITKNRGLQISTTAWHRIWVHTDLQLKYLNNTRHTGQIRVMAGGCHPCASSDDMGSCISRIHLQHVPPPYLNQYWVTMNNGGQWPHHHHHRRPRCPPTLSVVSIDFRFFWDEDINLLLITPVIHEGALARCLASGLQVEPICSHHP